MAVKIRLKRIGAKKKPFYRIVVADARYPRDGRFIEQIGIYDPMTNPARLTVDGAKALQWMKHGAQPTDTVRALLKSSGALEKATNEASEIKTSGETPAAAWLEAAADDQSGIVSVEGETPAADETSDSDDMPVSGASADDLIAAEPSAAYITSGEPPEAESPAGVAPVSVAPAGVAPEGEMSAADSGADTIPADESSAVESSSDEPSSGDSPSGDLPSGDLPDTN